MGGGRLILLGFFILLLIPLVSACDDYGGKDYYTKQGCYTLEEPEVVYDYCSGSVLIEYYCTSYDSNGECVTETIECEDGCSDGACLQIAETPSENVSCTDSDGGQDYETQGSCVSGDFSDMDYCDGNDLIEFYCLSNSCISEIVSCNYGCEDGACKPVTLTQPEICKTAQCYFDYCTLVYESRCQELCHNSVFGFSECMERCGNKYCGDILLSADIPIGLTEFQNLFTFEYGGTIVTEGAVSEGIEEGPPTQPTDIFNMIIAFFTHLWNMIIGYAQPPPGDVLAEGISMGKDDVSFPVENVTINGPQTINASVHNPENVSRNVTVKLVYNGSVISSINITIPPNSSTKVIFTLTFWTGGKYNLTVVAGNFTVAKSVVAYMPYWNVTRNMTVTRDGFELLDQHNYSEWGDNWCSPTSTGISMAWFHEHGHEGLISDWNNNGVLDEYDKYFEIDLIGKNFYNTSSVTGTTYVNKVKGLLNYLKVLGECFVMKVYDSESMAVPPVNDPMVTYHNDPTPQDYFRELQKGEDCLVSIRYPEGGGHAITGTPHDVDGHGMDDTLNDHGNYNASFVDPGDGSITGTEMRPDGKIWWGNRWVDFVMMIAVSPDSDCDGIADADEA